MEPILFVFSGPSGAGKGSVMRELMARDPQLCKVVTYTTRAPRVGERDGVDYRFVSTEEFQRLIECGDVYEYEQVYRDHFYGSPRTLFQPGRDGLIELDYKGREKYQHRYPRTISIFLLPPDLEELKRRILKRSPESNLEARLNNALEQIRHAATYDYIVKNEDLETCIRTIEQIIQAERHRRQGQTLLQAVLDQFQDSPS